MCLAELNVSLQPCQHRWYHLVRPCSPSSNLANCGRKLGISGWEIKCGFCPFCSEWDLSGSEYRLLGNDRTPFQSALTREPSLTLVDARRENRGGITRSDSGSSIMMAQEKNRAINARIESYLRVPQPEVASLSPVEDDEDAVLASTTSDTSSEGRESIRQPSTSSEQGRFAVIRRMRNRSKRLSLGFFK